MRPSQKPRSLPSRQLAAPRCPSPEEVPHASKPGPRIRRGDPVAARVRIRGESRGGREDRAPPPPRVGGGLGRPGHRQHHGRRACGLRAPAVRDRLQRVSRPLRDQPPGQPGVHEPDLGRAPGPRDVAERDERGRQPARPRQRHRQPERLPPGRRQLRGRLEQRRGNPLGQHDRPDELHHPRLHGGPALLERRRGHLGGVRLGRRGLPDVPGVRPGVRGGPGTPPGLRGQRVPAVPFGRRRSVVELPGKPGGVVFG